MKRWLVLSLMLCLFCSLVVQAEGKTPNVVINDKATVEQIKKEIARREGYANGVQGRSWKVISDEFEPGGSKGYFVSAYYKSSDSWNGYSTHCYADIWTVKDGKYTKLFDEIELTSLFGGGLTLFQMDGRSFAFIETLQYTQYATLKSEKCYLYSYEGNELVCPIENSIGASFDRDQQILVLYFNAPIQRYVLGNMSNAGSRYDNDAYFFTCENGELKELVGEPCTKEEFVENASLGQFGSWWITGIEEMGYRICNEDVAEMYFYRIPEVGYYINAIEYQDGYWLEGRGREVNFYHVLRINSDFLAGVVARHEGDTLKKLAEKYYGDTINWELLYDKNRDIIGNDPSYILPGMSLLLK